MPTTNPRKPSYLAGLWHIRGGPVSMLCIAIAVVITITMPALHFTVDRVFLNPERGVNIREIAPIALATILAAVTVPNFDRREKTSARSARLGHLAVSAVVLVTPLLLLPIWRSVVAIRYPEQELPPITGLIGNIALFACAAMILCLLGGRATAVIGTPMLFIAFVLAQQANPDSFLTRHFAYNLDWHTDWAITLIAAATTLALSWRLRFLPLKPS